MWLVVHCEDHLCHTRLRRRQCARDVWHGGPAHLHQRLDLVQHHGLVCELHHRLGLSERQGPQASAKAADQNQSFHPCVPCSLQSNPRNCFARSFVRSERPSMALCLSARQQLHTRLSTTARTPPLGDTVIPQTSCCPSPAGIWSARVVDGVLFVERVPFSGLLRGVVLIVFLSRVVQFQ